MCECWCGVLHRRLCFSERVGIDNADSTLYIVFVLTISLEILMQRL